jgi:hypothetical protein
VIKTKETLLPHSTYKTYKILKYEIKKRILTMLKEEKSILMLFSQKKPFFFHNDIFGVRPISTLNLLTFLEILWFVDLPPRF